MKLRTERTGTRLFALAALSGSEGTDWGDAEIGAAGGLVISVIALGRALVVSERRGGRTHRTAAPRS